MRRLRFENLVLDVDRRELLRDGAPVAVEPQVFDLLLYLIDNRDRVVSKDDVLNAVWQGRIVSESTLTTRINAARKALGDSGERQRLIRTLPRKGFRFVGKVHDGPPGGEPPIVSSSADRAPALVLPDRPSIAVLPFQNLSADPEQDYFADGVVEDVITALSRFKSLFVIARNSSFAYKGKAVDMRQVGRELGVRYVLEGSVRKAANRVRIGGQLIDASTGAHLWADHFDGILEDVFDLQDRVASSVVGAIAPKLEQAETERALRKPTESLDAYDCFLRATAQYHLSTRDSVQEARRLFRRATELDPTYASAHGFGSWCIGVCLTNGWLDDPEREVAEGVRLARRAVAIGMDDPVALSFGGGGLGHWAGETESGIVYVERAILLNPNLSLAWSESGQLRVYLGQHAEAILRLERAMRLSPLDLYAHRLYSYMGWAHLFAGRYDEAASWGRKAALEKPEWAVPLRIEAIGCALSGRREEAREALARMRAIDPNLRLSHLPTQRGVAARLRRAEDVALMMDGLRRAGLPE